MKKFALGWRIALLIILFCLIIGTVCVIDMFKPRNHFVPVKAVISDIVEEFDGGRAVYVCTTIVDYEYEGKKFEGVVFDKYDSSYHVGMEIDILVNPDNPTETDYARTDILQLIIASMSAAGAILGVICWIRGRKVSDL